MAATPGRALGDRRGAREERPGPAAWVVAGRSLRDVEARVDDLTLLAAAAWLAALVGSLVAVGAFEWAQGRLEARGPGVRPRARREPGGPGLPGPLR